MKSLVSRIKGYANTIREKVKKTKELTESFVQADDNDEGEREDFMSHNFNEPMILNAGINFDSGNNDTTVVMQHHSQTRRPKSGSMIRGKNDLAHFFASQNLNILQ